MDLTSLTPLVRFLQGPSRVRGRVYRQVFLNATKGELSTPLGCYWCKTWCFTDHPSGRYYTSFNLHNWMLSRCFYDFIRIIISLILHRSQEKTSKGVVNGTVIYPPGYPGRNNGVETRHQTWCFCRDHGLRKGLNVTTGCSNLGSLNILGCELPLCRSCFFVARWRFFGWDWRAWKCNNDIMSIYWSSDFFHVDDFSWMSSIFPWGSSCQAWICWVLLFSIFLPTEYLVVQVCGWISGSWESLS